MEIGMEQPNLELAVIRPGLRDRWGWFVSY